MSKPSSGRDQCYTEFMKKIEVSSVSMPQDKEQLYQFVQEHDQNAELITDINICLESFATKEVDDFLYEGLFNLYKNGNQRCQFFVLQFLPALISIYLSLLGRKIALGGGRLETLLLSIYNKEAATNTETPFVKSYKIPSLSNSSIYHEPASTTSALTERALSRHEQSEKPVMMNLPTQILNRITASTRSEVIATVLSIYNHSICAMVEASHVSFCKMVLRLTRSGFSNLDCDDARLLKVLEKSELDAIKHYTRIKFPNDVYQQMIIGLYFIMHDGFAETAIVALENLRVMSKHLLSGSLTMTLNALTDSIKRSLEETEVTLLFNPNKSSRRVVDLVQRRYAVSSTNLLPRPSSVKDCVDYGFNGTVKDNVPSKEEVIQKIVASGNDKNESPLPLRVERIVKVPSESDDEAASESTTLLNVTKNEIRTEKSAVSHRHEIMTVTVLNGNSIEAVDVVDNEASLHLVENAENSDSRLDTAL